MKTIRAQLRQELKAAIESYWRKVTEHPGGNPEQEAIWRAHRANDVARLATQLHFHEQGLRAMRSGR